MWSQWVWEMRTVVSARGGRPAADSARAAASRPVPASRNTRPVAPRTSMQGVLPPYRTVPGPGTGVEPRTPQKVSCIAPAPGDGKGLLPDTAPRSPAPCAGSRPPGGRKQCGAVADDDLLPRDGEDLGVRELAHRAGDGLATGADHLGDGLVGEPLRDPGAVFLVRHPEEEVGHAPVHVEGDEVPDLVVRPPEALGDFAEQPHRQVGRLAEA